MAGEKTDPVIEAPVVVDVPVAEVVADAPPVAERAPSLVEAAADVVAEPPAEVIVEKPAEVVVEKPADVPVEVVADKPPEGEKPVEVVKEGDKPPVDGEKPADELKADEKPIEAEPAKPEPIEYEYEPLPETIVLEDTQREELNVLLDGFRADPKKGFQPILEFGAAKVKEAAEQTIQMMTTRQYDVWASTQQEWITQAKADPIIGGAAWNTSMGRVAQARDSFVSDAPRDTPEWTSERQEFINMMDATGVGNHPAFLKFLYRVGRFIKEPTTRDMPQDTKPAPQTPQGKNPLHDNPRSHRNGAG